MSFLAPLYALGALTILAPIVFHLIRRTTKDETPFGSLMFLEPSPPRVSKRSRLENWPLLLLRAAVLAILAAAFARPFLRQTAAIDAGGAAGERVVVLIDASASLRRGGLWPQAVSAAVAEVDARSPHDELAVYAFDDASRPVFTFAEWSALDDAGRRATARARIEALEPSWRSTRLGQALVDAAGAVEEAGDAARDEARAPRRIVLISDLQQGSRLDALGDFDWPSDLSLDVRSLTAEGSNAAVERIAEADEESRPAGLRVRISNDADADREAFTLAWDGDADARAIPATVPAGESRVVRVPSPTSDRQALRLSGDDHDFDDVLYVATEPERSATVLFVGPDRPDDPEGLLYYLSRACEGLPGRPATVERRDPGSLAGLAAEPPPALVALAVDPPPAAASALADYADRGGTILAVPAVGRAEGLAAIVGAPAFDVSDGEQEGDLMLGAIAFDHPLFVAVAAPQFNDFTKIRFRRHRKLPPDALGASRIVARFEGGDAAVLDRRIGRGRLIVMTSGWGPADGRLARSSKFVPLIAAMLNGPEADAPEGPLLVGRSLPIPDGTTAVIRPDGSSVAIAPDASTSLEADVPGVYVAETPSGPRRLAVNLDPAESRTTPMGVDALERAGCRLIRAEAPPSNAPGGPRQLQAMELEGKQKLWRPLILAALGVLVVETWLAGRLDRRRPVPVEAA